MKIVRLESKKIMTALLIMQSGLSLTHTFAIFTGVVTVGAFAQSWILEPNIWWFRTQSMLGAMGAVVVLLSVQKARRSLIKGIDAARLEEPEVADDG